MSSIPKDFNAKKSMWENLASGEKKPPPPHTQIKGISPEKKVPIPAKAPDPKSPPKQLKEIKENVANPQQIAKAQDVVRQAISGKALKPRVPPAIKMEEKPLQAKFAEAKKVDVNPQQIPLPRELVKQPITAPENKNIPVGMQKKEPMKAAHQFIPPQKKMEEKPLQTKIAEEPSIKAKKNDVNPLQVAMPQKIVKQPMVAPENKNVPIQEMPKKEPVKAAHQFIPPPKKMEEKPVQAKIAEEPSIKAQKVVVNPPQVAMPQKIVKQPMVAPENKNMPIQAKKEPVQARDKRFEFNSTIWSLFNESKPIPGQGEIVLSGYVLADGRGDYVHMTTLAKKLHKQFPDRKIRLIVISAESHRDKLPVLKDPICTTHLAYYDDYDLGSPIISSKDSPFDKDMSPYIQKADIWFSGPIGIEGLFDNLKKEAKTKGIAIMEYDKDTNMASQSFDLKLQLGLGTPLGVFTQKIKDPSWRALENDNLNNLLFTTSHPSQEKIDNYTSSHQLFMCYQASKSNFFNEAVQFSAKHYPDKSIDICFPSRRKMNSKEEIEKNIDIELLKKQGIASVTWIDYDNNKKNEIVFPIQEKGKVLRIINPGTLSKKDFKLITFMSAPLVGCTGDHSLTQALSYGKIPAYQMAGHKRQLAINLRDLAIRKFGEEAPLSKFLGEMDNHPKEILENKLLIEQAKEFSDFIRDEYSFNRHIKGIINERLYRAKDPDFVKFEEEQRNNYIYGNISADQLKEQMKKELVKRGVLTKN